MSGNVERCPTCGRMTYNMDTTMTKRLRQYHRFIQSHFKRFGAGPTYSEIADAMGVSSLATVWEAVDRLARLGLVTLRPGKGRRSVIVEVRDD